MPGEQSSRAAAVYDAASATFDSGPLSFWRHYGARTIERLGLLPGASVLDVACGTGSSAIPAAHAVGERGFVTAVDVSEGMLARVRDKARGAGLANVTTVHCDMTSLAYPDRTFDAVVCVFGVFFAPDMTAFVRNLWRMVKPGGVLAVTSWGEGRFEPLATAFADAVIRVRPGTGTSSEPWRQIGTPQKLAQFLLSAGVENVTVDTETFEVKIESPPVWWEIVMGSGSRGRVDSLEPQEVEHVRQVMDAFIVQNNVTSVPTTGLFSIGRKGPARSL